MKRWIPDAFLLKQTYPHFIAPSEEAPTPGIPAADREALCGRELLDDPAASSGFASSSPTDGS